MISAAVTRAGALSELRCADRSHVGSEFSPPGPSHPRAASQRLAGISLSWRDSGHDKPALANIISQSAFDFRHYLDPEKKFAAFA